MVQITVVAGDFAGKMVLNELNYTFYIKDKPVAEALSIEHLEALGHFRSDPSLIKLFYLLVPVIGWFLGWLASGTPNMAMFAAHFADGRYLMATMDKDAYVRLADVLRHQEPVAENANDPGPALSIPEKPEGSPDGPIYRSFGYKTGWIAVRAGSMEDVALALGLREPVWMPWFDGIELSCTQEEVQEHFFAAILPPIDGWVLMASKEILYDQFPGRVHDAVRDGLHATMADLSERYGEAQLFATYRVSDAHAWGRWEKGELHRLVSEFNGEVDQYGRPTPIEADILKPYDPEEDPDFIIINEEDVMTVAGDWSVNPADLDDNARYRIEEKYVLTGWLPRSGR